MRETVPVAQVATTIEELPPRVAEALGELAGVAKEGRHEALADVYESIEELRHYRKHFLVEPPAAA